MKKLMTMLATRRDTQKGATIIEYALIAALISIAALVALGAVGTDVNSVFEKVSATIS